MKNLPLLCLLSIMSLPLLAQTAPSRKQAPAKPAQARQVPGAPSAPSVPAALTPEQQALSERVYAGHLPCELGASVRIDRDAGTPGYFHVHLDKHRYHMAPVATTTGAIRLEDRHAGVVWLQLANKSMMMSDKLGRRLVDACMNPDQERVAQAMASNPAPSVLDPVALPALMRGALAVQEAAE